MFNKRMTVAFFHVDSNAEFDFPALVTGTMGLGPLERVIALNGTKYRLEEVTQSNSYVDGELSRIRTGDHPGKVQLDVDGVQDLGLKSDEYLSEATAFSYRKDLRAIAIQKNYFAATPKTVEKYLHAFANGEAFYFRPVLELQQMQKLATVQEFRRIELQVARAGGAVYSGLGLTGRALADIMKDSGAPHVSLELKMGHDRGSLPTKYVKRIAKNLLDLAAGTDEDSKTVQTLKVGARVNEETQVIDLLEGRIEHKVSFTSDDRRVPYSVRRAHLHKAWDVRGDEVRQVLSEDE
jgi:hypothetical protein